MARSDWSYKREIVPAQAVVHCLCYVHRDANRCVDAIALTVTRVHRYASYTAKDSHGWLLPMVREDVVGMLTIY